MLFERVFQQHAPYVWRALRRLGVAESDADDVCQDVFIVVHRKLGTFGGILTPDLALRHLPARRLRAPEAAAPAP